MGTLTDPSITVIVAAHNAEETLASSLDSILNQEYDGDLEVVVTNDGSTDGTADILAEYPVTVLEHPDRRGRAAARNSALAATRTDYVAIQDADDVSLPGRFTVTSRLLDGSRVVAGSQLHFEDPQSGPYAGYRWPTQPEGIRSRIAAGLTPIPHPTMLAPREAIARVGGYRRQFPVAEDLDLMLRMAEFVVFSCAPVPLVSYRRPRRDTWLYLLRSEFARASVLTDMGLGSGSRNSALLRATRSYLGQRRPHRWDKPYE